MKTLQRKQIIFGVKMAYNGLTIAQIFQSCVDFKDDASRSHLKLPLHLGRVAAAAVSTMAWDCYTLQELN